MPVRLEVRHTTCICRLGAVEAGEHAEPPAANDAQPVCPAGSRRRAALERPSEATMAPPKTAPSAAAALLSKTAPRAATAAASPQKSVTFDTARSARTAPAATTMAATFDDFALSQRPSLASRSPRGADGSRRRAATRFVRGDESSDALGRDSANRRESPSRRGRSAETRSRHRRGCRADLPRRLGRGTVAAAARIFRGDSRGAAEPDRPRRSGTREGGSWDVWARLWTPRRG